MKLFSNKLFLGGSIVCLVLIVGVYFFIQSKAENSVINQTPQGDTTTRVLKSSKGVSKLVADDADPWRVWIQEQADLWVKLSADQLRNNDTIWTEDSLRESFVSYLTENLEMFKKGYDIPPPLFHTTPTLTTKWNTTGKKYDGPPTPEALMEAFHSKYVDEILDSWAERHPPENFLQMLLNRGIAIKNFSEYCGYMNAWSFGFHLENDPLVREMSAREHGIPESDLEALTAAATESMIEREQRSSNASRADEKIRGGVHVGENFYPFYIDRNITYVKHTERPDGFGAVYYGQSLTDEQRFNLIFRGIEPEGIEIVYIDKLGNRLSEKPEPASREEVRKMMAKGENLPPEEWWDPNAPIPASEDFEEFLPPERTDAELDSRKQRTREEFERTREEFERHAKEVARQPEFEQFMREVRQLEKFATMSDAEIAAELEKQLRQQLLPGLPTEQSLEDALREKITPKPLTPERFNKAKQILQNYGPKEGLRRLAKADPELAEYFRRNPQKVPPKRSQPSNTDDSQKE